MLKLTKIQEDALREVGNVGAGRASISLAKLTNKKVKMNVTKVRLLGINEVISVIDKPATPSIGILFDVNGNTPGCFLILSTRETTKSLLKMVDMESSQKKGSMLGKTDKDTLKEIGNIITGSYLAALSDFTKINMIESLPKLLEEKSNEIMKETLSKCGNSVNQVIAIDSQIIIKEEGLMEELIILFKPDPLKKILNSLEMKLKVR